MYNMGFSKGFFLWLINYLSNRCHFVQIDDRYSGLANVAFGVPQGSVLSPAILNLYVPVLQDRVQCSCSQYADDTKMCLRTKVSNLDEAIAKMIA